jgi:NAD(P)-dependent dehydrogenase (short-subunit alcohol dehydrogenase family)
MDLQLADKIAWVTGAGGGIGAAIATTLAAEGCTVYVADNNANAAADVAAECGERGHPLPLDVGNASESAAAVRRIVKERGRIDIVVNNAGILKTGSVLEASIADWDDVCRVNLSGVYYCCKAVFEPMVAQRYGKIVNVASVSAMKGGGTFGNVLYGTTKAGVVALTKGLARELAPHGINVNAIAPGVVETNMTNSLLTPERRKAVLGAIPLGRLASTGDIARVACMLASDLFAYIAGETVTVDGGYLTR